MQGRSKVEAEFERLQEAADVFKAALDRFKRTFNPERTGIVEFQEHIDNVLFDIYEEVEEELY